MTLELSLVSVDGGGIIGVASGAGLGMLGTFNTTGVAVGEGEDTFTIVGEVAWGEGVAGGGSETGEEGVALALT